MKKFTICLLCLFAFSLPKPVFAFNSFVPYHSNPLTFTSQANWNETGVSQGNILIENGIFKSWHTSIGSGVRVAYGTSTNGFSWQTEKVYNFNNSQDTHDAAIIKTNSQYNLYFSSLYNNQSRILKVTSDDGINFANNTILSLITPTQPWEINGISGSTLFFEDGIYFLFYEGLNSNWSVGLATSNDNLNFVKCSNNPIIQNNTTVSSIVKLSNTYYLFFHSPNGIEYMQTDKLGCDSVWTNRTVVLPYGFFPYVIRNGDELWMYYSTNDGGLWHTNLAISQLDEQETARKPVILIPGLFASWNKDAILHNTSVLQSDWQLNPIVQEYEGFGQTMETLGYHHDENYFVFPYDWRQSIERSADDLNTFITNLQLEEKPRLVGHSLGGLVGRIYAQKYGNTLIDKLVAVGSPHQGTALVYPAVEGGEADTRDEKMWLTEKLFLQLYRQGLETDRQIINKYLPVLQNMFPTYDFLKKDDQTIPLKNMSVQNNLLPAYNATFGNLFDQLQTVVGEQGHTVLGYTVSERGVLDILLDYYPDGKLKDPLHIQGDGTIISFSASAGNNISVLNKNHGALMYSKEGIKTILHTLDVSIEDSQITEGKRTHVFPSLIFLMLSPAKLEVEGSGRTYEENQGILFVENPPSGKYTVRARGKENGRYAILVGQLTQNGDFWNRIEGNITASPPTSQTDLYSIDIDVISPNPIVLPPIQIFDELHFLLEDLQTTSSKKTDKANSFTRKAKEALNKNHKTQAQTHILQAVQSLMQVFTNLSDEEKNIVLQFMEQSELLYGSIEKAGNRNPIINLQNTIRAESKKTQRILIDRHKRGENTLRQAYILKVIEDKQSAADSAVANKNYSYARILLENCKMLLKTI